MSDNPKEAPPRLGIIHLFVWISLNAILFGVTRPLILETSSASPYTLPSLLIALVQYSMAIGGGPLLFIARRWRGKKFPTEPGEWILLAMGTDALLKLVVFRVLIYVLSLEEFSNGYIWQAYISLAIVPICLWCIPIFFVSKTSWRWFFAFESFYFCAETFQRVSHISGIDTQSTDQAVTSAVGLAVIAFIYSVVSDWRRSAKRGWSHGIGLLAFSLYAVRVVLQAILGTRMY